jgi:hypothetical protein
MSPVVIARSGSDEAIPKSGRNRIATSLSLLAMTTKGSSAAARHNEKSWQPMSCPRVGSGQRDNPEQMCFSIRQVYFYPKEDLSR